MRKNRKYRTYICKECFAEFNSYEELDLHYTLAHSEDEDYVYLD